MGNVNSSGFTSLYSVPGGHWAEVIPEPFIITQIGFASSIAICQEFNKSTCTTACLLNLSGWIGMIIEIEELVNVACVEGFVFRFEPVQPLMKAITVAKMRMNFLGFFIWIPDFIG